MHSVGWNRWLRKAVVLNIRDGSKAEFRSCAVSALPIGSDARVTIPSRFGALRFLVRRATEMSAIMRSVCVGVRQRASVTLWRCTGPGAFSGP